MIDNGILEEIKSLGEICDVEYTLYRKELALGYS